MTKATSEHENPQSEQNTECSESATGTPLGHDPHRKIGYGNPPRHTQFKRGQSGNPRGRPRRKKPLSTMLDELLYRPVEVKEGGRKRKMPAVQALLHRLYVEAMKGDHKAMDRLFKLRQSLGDPNEESTEAVPMGPSPAEKEMLAELASWINTAPDAPVIEDSEDDSNSND